MIPLILLLSALVVTNTTTPDYQHGFYDGAKAGLTMGQWQGAAPYNADAYQGLGDVCLKFNSVLKTVFGVTDNRTTELWQSKPGNPYADDNGLGISQPYYSNGVYHDVSWLGGA